MSEIEEKPIQEGIQETFQEMDQFAKYPDSVVINDWDIWDRPIIEAPFVLIENSDNLLYLQDTSTQEMVWEIPVSLIVPFIAWKQSRDDLRDLRSATIQQFKGGNLSPGTEDDRPVWITQIRNDGPITEIRQAYGGQENQADSLPIYVFQTLIFETSQEL